MLPSGVVPSDAHPSWIPRHARPLVERALRESRVVALLGPRQVGKTSLARRVAEERGGTYRSLDEQQVLRDVVMAALHTGMRRGELLALRWRCIDLGRREIVIEAATEKAGRGRVVPMTEELCSRLG